MLTPSPTMLTGQAALLSPDRLHVLASMGHGDEPVLADASFPAASHARRIVPLIGADAPQVLDAVPGVMPLDDFFDQAAFTMQAVSDLASVPQVVRAFNATLQQHGCGKNGGQWIGQVLTGNIRRRSMNGFEQTGARGSDGGRRQEAQ